MTSVIPNFNAATHTQYGSESNSIRGWSILTGPGAVNSIPAGCEGRWSIEMTTNSSVMCSYTVELEGKASIPAGTTFTIGFQSRKHSNEEVLLTVRVNDDNGQVIIDEDPLSKLCKAYKQQITLTQSLQKICFQFAPSSPDSRPIIDGLWLGFGDSPSGGGGGADPTTRPSGPIQDFIDGRLTNETLPMSVIKMEGMSGDAYVPPGVNVQFYDCILGSIEFGGDNSFFIKGGSIDQLYIGTGCDFWIEGPDFIIKSEIWGSDGTIKDTEFQEPINVYEQSNIELIDTVHIDPNKVMNSACSSVKMLRPTATVPKAGIHGKQTNLIISGAHFEQQTGYAVKVEDHSYLQITDSHIEGYFDCPAVTVADNSVGIITQGDGYCPADKGLFSGQWVVKASNGSYVRVKDSHIVGSPGNWSDYGIWADENSVVEAIGNSAVRLEGGDEPCIRSSRESSVSVTNYLHVTCATKEAIYCDDHSKVRIFGLTDKIQSDAVDAIWIRDHSRVEVYDVPLIYAPVGDAVDMSQYCDFIGVNITDKMEGLVDYGILATVYSNAKLDGVVACIGDGEDGVYLEDHSRLIAVNGEYIMGKGDNGVEAKDNCQIVIKNYTEEVVGLATDGIHMEDSCQAVLYQIAKVRGVGKDGIYMKNDCRCQSRYCEEIVGEARDGISMENSCRSISINDTLIRGMGRDGIHGEDSCEATSKRGEKILGEGRDGIYMEDGKLINVQRTQEIRGEGRDGIHADHCNVDVYFVDVLHGDGDKCLYLETCVGTVETVPDGYGASYGLYEVNQSDIRVFRSDIAGANPLSLFMNNSSRLFAKDVHFKIKDAKTAEDCETYLENVTIDGKFESLNDCKHEWLRVKIMDRIDFTDTIYRWKEVEVIGKHECLRCTGKVEKAEVGGSFEDQDSENHFSDYTLSGSIDHTNCTTKLKGSNISGQIKLSSCTLIGENTTVGEITDFTSSQVTYGASQVASIDGKSGSAYKQLSTISADITLNDSSGEMKGGETGSVTLTNSSLFQRSGTAGAVTGSTSTYEHHAATAGAVIMTTGSVSQYGGILGTVSVTNGGYINQGGTAAAVDITNGGFALLGGTVATVSLTSSGLIQQGGTAGSVTLSSAAFTGKGGTCGSVSGSGALELISMSSGAITVGHKTLPACVPGMVARVGTDKLYEVFDKNVKRWFDENLEERITKSKKVNVEEDSYQRISGKYELDVGKDASLISSDDMELHTGGAMDIFSGSTMTLNTLQDFALETNFDISISSMIGSLTANIFLSISLLATIAQTRSALAITDLAPSYSQTSGTSPPVPTAPDTPDSPDAPEEPVP